ncbi:hypothetical protein LKD70_16280 [Ruminococcus sp. CLA-AA-H200]|uniref:Uncharacterized protein n=1 Tax=Ruminococcus turbiniformis TaxID=2881258 RepID=A0ABS8G0W9_9FIRM|nr:hypothetical protein [Ruminococcus turbiniformis]MCC2255950.1 hypothetical protein [Ruminococcus turbiniformis]
MSKMTLEEAKRRADYSFQLNGMDGIIDQIRRKQLEGFGRDTCSQMIGAAVMEIGYVDIEVNIFSKAQVTEGDDTKDDMTPVIDYFVCVKNIHEEWVSDGYLEYTPKVDWDSDNWIAHLERDMFEALDSYVDKKHYSYGRPNSSWLEELAVIGTKGVAI